MDLTKISFSDQVLSSPRKKVSRFGLGIVLSFIVVSVVLFNISSKGPFLNPVFQGFNSFGSHSNSSFLSWPFSSGFSTSSDNNSTASDCNDNSIVKNLQQPVSVNETLEANVLGSNKSSNFVDFNGKDEILENAHLGNVSGKVKDGSFIGGESDSRNGSRVSGNTTLVDGIGKGKELDKINKGDSVENMRIESVSVKENATKIEAREDGNAGNYSNIREDGDSRNKGIKECDIYNGRWVRDNTKPYYPADSCPYIDRDFDCHLNGRPDNEFVKWRWQPYDCDIPRFNTTDFLERLRGKKLVFVGDSLNRNMWESLDYNCTIDFVSSPFLVKESSFNGKNGSFETLRLDLMDGTTSMYHDADVIIFNTGHWWTHEKTSRGEDYYQEGNYVHPSLKVLEAYKRALVTWAHWVDKNIDKSRTEVIYRGYSVTHFRGGPWNSGGQCHKETEPIFNDTYLAKYPSKMKILEYVLKDMKTPVTYLNISRLTDYRKDGHPSIYRPDYQAVQQDPASVHAQDCSHWCLPGVPDTWNQLLYVSLLKSGRGSWRD
ncbi:hypothetical protein RD792_008399 [Penstemon davidsonii]|uniref:Trichome birefringence-like N-terminal domain-containing protein n=1 Tax=Penstemon davidsonii TaxID=160366 RepID=A0ABR0DAL1_9LAMI|nr:hypothetical protein RD792_008399 [Penstemon davidsonii]